jgi:aspartate/methionine/tyrosine aminotransferase
MNTIYKDITQHEIEALKHEYNMSDAHTHQSQSPSQKEIVRRLPELWYEAEQSRYIDIEQKFIRTFFEFRKQPAALRNNTFLVAYSASISTAIVADYFAQKKMSIAVLEPCFDNLVDILKLSNNVLDPLPESVLFESEDVYTALQESVQADAIYITDPNNPTGKSLMMRGEHYWSELIRFCKDYNKLLMVDFCFSPMLYLNEEYIPFDVYEMLEASGISYITLEDTGKSWPIQDMKASILKSSQDVYVDLFDISTVYLLQVSPFALRVLIEYLKDAMLTDFDYTRKLFLKNWETARQYLQGSIATIQEPDTPAPVIWCRLPDGVDAEEVKEFLEKNNNVHVVPGKYFFWAHPEENKHFFRLALARDAERFTQSMKHLIIGLDTYEKHFIKK